MTLVEAVVVVCVIGLVILLLMPMLRPPAKRHHYISCSNNLKQVALAMKVWEGDNNDKYPMGLSVTNGGTRELMETSEAWRTFQVMSNELSTPRILQCPEDSTRTNYIQGFGEALKTNISYFINIVPDDSNPQGLISGDDNFMLKKLPVPRGSFNVTSNSEIEWDVSRHFNQAKQSWFTATTKASCGYLMMADGSVQFATGPALKVYIQNSNVETNRFVIP